MTVSAGAPEPLLRFAMVGVRRGYARMPFPHSENGKPLGSIPMEGLEGVESIGQPR